MKQFKDFLIVEDVASDDDTLLPEGFVYSEEPLFEGESVQHSDIPAMLVMRRTSVRMFPNGQKIALYKIDKLNKFITIPYNNDNWVLTADSHK